MTEKNEYAAKIRSKGLDNTGVTEDVAKDMFNTLGRSTLAIVELEHKRKIDDDDTGRTVELVVRLIEPSTSETLDAHLRELMRTMHQNRVLTAEDQQLQIETMDDLEPTVEGVIAAGQVHISETDDELPNPDDEADETTEPTEATASDEPPWEYDAPEGVNSTVDDPFAITTT